MALFGNLFGKKPAPREESPAPKAGPGAPVDFFPEGVDMSDWDQVFSACLGKMYTVQIRLAELVKDEPDWYVDFEKGTLTLGKHQFRVQFLGSESYVSNSWLWGWENVNNFPNNVLGQAHIARTYGQAWGLEPLMYPQCELNDTFNGHNFSMVVCCPPLWPCARCPRSSLPRWTASRLSAASPSASSSSAWTTKFLWRPSCAGIRPPSTGPATPSPPTLRPASPRSLSRRGRITESRI